MKILFAVRMALKISHFRHALAVYYPYGNWPVEEKISDLDSKLSAIFTTREHISFNLCHVRS